MGGLSVLRYECFPAYTWSNWKSERSATLERTRREIYQSTGNPTALAYVLYGDTNVKFIK
jgi:hypothetical protein